MTDAELCRRNGWTPGTILTGFVNEDIDVPPELAEVITPMNGVLVLRITAIGEEEVLSRPLMLNGELMEEGECLFQLDGTAWEEVGSGWLVSRRLS